MYLHIHVYKQTYKHMFHIHANKRIQEFHRIQTEQSKQSATMLKRSWIDAVKNGICEPLANIPEGHYMFLGTKDKNAYEKSKLKRYLKYLFHMYNARCRYIGVAYTLCIDDLLISWPVLGRFLSTSNYVMENTLRLVTVGQVSVGKISCLLSTARKCVAHAKESG